MSLLLPQVPSLDNTFGAVLIGTILGAILYGLTSHQTYRYYRLYPTDPLILKLMVAVIWFLDTLHTALSMHVCYYYLVTHYFQPERLLSGVWSMRLTIITTGLVIAITHVFFARRIFLIGNRNIYLMIVMGLLLITETGFCLTATIETFIAVTFAAYTERFTWLIPCSLGTAVIIDSVTTSTLTYYLHKCRTGFRKTDSLIGTLIVYTINTGLLNGLLNLAAMLAAALSPKTLIYYGIDIASSKMYANSLLAVLNARRSLLDRGLEGFETGSFGLEVFDPNKKEDQFPVKAAPPQMHKLPTVIDVQVTTEMFCDAQAAEGDTEGDTSYRSTSMIPQHGSRF
ncbi:hypothetical protein L226DRAFT_261810 [Lentinus tigrinus ALCF2SS1-7]|uniref:DUF6534 domain-containing protein n=1 Tax=Lentinus tigrinus ALCF2SS1-6 TaxID=1328759 RepID=A0A5C2RWA5_9APHY|nr:hypothetical protein L227DRAFT_615881 [Lentinus tigrinus ALCF2SS1-6]RPD69887.1 hypothetical protein L226DRAFT_261810 [Lentinus tigrinus ALCF2SS1-7]